VEFTLPKKFVKGEFIATPILNDKSGFRSFILYPRFDKAGNFLGGIGVEFNFEDLRSNLKKVTEESSRILFLDSQFRIISADNTKVLGESFIKFLNSQLDSPLSIEIEDLVELGNLNERVFRNSRRTILNISVAPLQVNLNKVFIINYHFLEDFKILDILPKFALGEIIMASVGVLISFILVLFLNFKFSEHLEFEVEKRTMELLKSEEKYRSIVENPFFGAYLMDASGFKYVNDKFCEIFGYSKDEILNLKDYSILIHPEDRERLNQQLRRRLKGELEVNKWSARGLRKDGQVIFIEGYTKRVEYEGKPAAQGMIIDVTEEIKRREALQQAQKLEALGTLAGGIAHDFNNILQIVIGAAQLLKMKVKDSEYTKWIDTIETTALRGADLARRLLTFSRKKPTGEMRPIDIHRLIEDSVKVFRETFPRNIEIETHFNAENHIILGEEAQVQQVVLNLAINARDAMPEGGKLIFRTENRVGDGLNGKSDVEYLVMHVIDTGIGMTEEVKRRIFEPFFTTKPPGKGTGLGLSTVYGIVKSYDGFIKVYSEVGKGTKFSIYIPVYKERKEKDEAREKEEVKVKKTGTLLLIDDEEDIRFAGKELLEAEGFKVYTAGDGIEGLNIYREHKGEIDLVILDLNMPKMSGKETLSQLLLIDPNVKVIISTGYITESEKEEVEGVVGFIEKPFDINKLLKMISEALK
jgi:PAS domain S-box-containing protein